MTETAHRRLRTETMTIPVSNGQSVEFGEAEIRIIADARNRAAAAIQSLDAGEHRETLRDLRRELAGRIGVPEALIRTALAAVKTDDLYVVEFKGEPDHLDLAVQWERGWKVYEVTGTRHAYYLLRKLVEREGFQGARLNDVLLDDKGWQVDNVISLSVDDITGSDRFGKYRALLDRSNAHYDLERDDKAR